MRVRRLRAELLGVGVLAVAAVVWSVVGRPANSFKGQPIDPPRAAPDFTLVDQYGRPFSFADLRGKVAAVFFGYTHCPDVCPTTLTVFAQAARRLQGTPAAEAVRFVFVSVDPERDTPERLRQYVEAFDTSIIALTGAPGQVQRVLEAWGIMAQKVWRSSDDYEMVHTASVLLVDRSGRLRLRLPFGSSAEDLVHDVQELLRS